MQQLNKQKSVSCILQQSKNELFSIVNKVNELNKLNQCLHSILEKKLAEHCQVANLENNTLLIVADNSNWATRIRYMIPDLINQLKKNPLFSKLKKIECIISIE